MSTKDFLAQMVMHHEINQIREQIEKARGQIQDLSVSVLINSPALEAADMEKVQTLVAGATGLDAGYIVVQHMPFTAANLLQEQLEEALSRKPSVFTPALIRDLVLYGLLALAALFLLLLMYRFFSNVSLGTAAITTAMVQETAAADGGIAQIDLDEGPPTVQTQIEKLAKQRPAEVAQLLRTWLSED
jgi:flagellar M-ring protein FliF